MDAKHRFLRFATALAAAASLFVVATASAAENAAEAVLSAVVRVEATIPTDARTAESLGTERSGSGVVIDDRGLVVTIGYLILEAMTATVSDAEGRDVPAEIVAYDYDTGFGLLRALKPLGIRPVRFGDSSALEPGDPVLAVAAGGAASALPVYVTSRGAFAGYWEYLLDSAIFVAPPHPRWAGAALFDRDGRLAGIGSLVVSDSAPDRPSSGDLPGNMFVPIDLLGPILGDLLASGRVIDPPRPWLGFFTREGDEGVVVFQVAPGGPAAAAGIEVGDVVAAVAGKPVSRMADMFRTIWDQGAAGTEIPLTLRRGGEERAVAVRSRDRYRWLRLDPSY